MVSGRSFLRSISFFKSAGSLPYPAGNWSRCERREVLRYERKGGALGHFKVITRDGTVTLRGPVETDAELEAINALVEAIPGIQSIDNQLQAKN
nr:BON domain-containing protein [Gammaproteobacteria bacterium]